MPVDKDGNRAHFVSGPDSVPGRMNLGRLYEPFFNAAARDIRRNALEMMSIPRQFSGEMTLEEVADIPQNLRDSVWQMILKYYQIISDKQFATASTYGPQEILTEIYFIINNQHLYNFMPIDNDRNYDLVVMEVEKNFKLTYGPVTYRGRSGNMVTTKENIRIAPVSMMILDKIADSYLAVDIGKFSTFGILTGTPQQDRYEAPWRRTPPKNVGETESRLYASYCGPEMVGEMMDRHTSIPTQRAIAHKLLFSAVPSNIDNLVDRDIYPLGCGRPNQILQHRLMCCGFKLAYRPENIRNYGEWK